MLTTACCVVTANDVGSSRQARLAEDEGQDLIEYALLTGIIAIAGILVFPAIQNARWSAPISDWNDNAQAIWEPPPLARRDAPSEGTWPSEI